ncbi:hypothetical protein C8R44DRAFT_749874 [Mycena epipterygia]|nr:hypothetical protein C8R44DRAFT_749874 [Mycena epipterygia]
MTGSAVGTREPRSWARPGALRPDETSRSLVDGGSLVSRFQDVIWHRWSVCGFWGAGRVPSESLILKKSAVVRNNRRGRVEYSRNGKRTPDGGRVGFSTELTTRDVDGNWEPEAIGENDEVGGGKNGGTGTCKGEMCASAGFLAQERDAMVARCLLRGPNWKLPTVISWDFIAQKYCGVCAVKEWRNNKVSGGKNRQESNEGT